MPRAIAQRRQMPGLEVVALGLDVDAGALRAGLAQALQELPGEVVGAPVATAAAAS